MKLSQIVLETRKPILETNNSYLYEGLTLTEARSLNLWESAGRQIVEAELTSDQIQQLFSEIEKGATAVGGNRTMVGKGKDAATAVNKAWEDLKGKIQDSGPIKAVDQKFDDAVAKIEAGLGGPDNKVNQVIQKYRKFAKDRPISQSLIYAALIAAAGISGAGLGGAAVLGLLKMTDKLLQGEKFSSAAYAGGKTGALAYGAGQIGQAMKGDDSETFAATAADARKQAGDEAMKAVKDALDKGADPNLRGELDSIAQSAAEKYSTLQGGPISVQSAETIGQKAAAQAIKSAGQTAVDADAASSVAKSAAKSVAKSAADNLPSTSDVADKIMSDPDLAAKMSKSAVDSIANINDQAAKAAWAAVQKQVESGELTDHKRLSFALNRALNQAFSDFGTNPYSPGADFSKRAAREIIAKAKDTESLLAALQGGKTESVARVSKRISEHKIKIYQTRPLSEGQIYLLFDRVVENNVRLINEGVVVTSRLNEGPMDFLKKAAGKTVSKLSSFGKNLTTKVTASKLLSAWKKEGSPTDSEKLNSFLSAQGVAPEVIQSSFKSMNIQPPTGKQEPEADSSAAGSEKPAPADTDSAQSQKDNAATQNQPADKVAKDADGTSEKPAAPAGTIGLAQQGSTGSATAPASDKTATSKPEPADDQTAPTAAKATPADSQAAPTVGKVDVIGLAKMIKQQKPPVVDAIKKLLNSREAQRAD